MSDENKNNNENADITWKDIFKYYFLIKTFIPGILLIIYIFLTKNVNSDNNLLVGIGIVLVLSTIFGLLSLLYVIIVKIFQNKIK